MHLSSKCERIESLCPTTSARSFFFLGHLSHSGDLLLWVGVRRRALTSSSQELLRQS